MQLRRARPRRLNGYVSPFASRRLVPKLVAPCNCLRQTHATYAPSVAHPVTRYPMALSWEIRKLPVLTPSSVLRRFIGDSLSFVFLSRTCQVDTGFSSDAHHRDS